MVKQHPGSVGGQRPTRMSRHGIVKPVKLILGQCVHMGEMVQAGHTHRQASQVDTNSHSSPCLAILLWRPSPTTMLPLWSRPHLDQKMSWFFNMLTSNIHQAQDLCSPSSLFQLVRRALHTGVFLVQMFPPPQLSQGTVSSTRYTVCWELDHRTRSGCQFVLTAGTMSFSQTPSKVVSAEASQWLRFLGVGRTAKLAVLHNDGNL